MADPEQLTTVLRSALAGDDQAQDELYRAVYAELHRMAQGRLRHSPHHTIQATALVNEAYVKIFEGAEPAVRDRSHFFALSSRVMRQVLVDYFRRRSAERRGGAGHDLTLEEALTPGPTGGETILAVHEALDELTGLDARMAQVVECKFFGGMTQPEIAQVLGVSERTVRREWKAAKVWLGHRLEKASG